jgi:uncharacterized LabA/DUF88 family protein
MSDDRVGLFVDVNNLFYYVNRRWAGKRINYNTFLEQIENMDDSRLMCSIAYGTHTDDRVAKFQDCLSALNFELKYRKVEEGTFFKWDVGIAVDMCVWAPRLDIIILATGTRDMVPAIEHVKAQGVKVYVYAASIHKDVRAVANEIIEIEEWMLIDPSERIEYATGSDNKN